MIILCMRTDNPTAELALFEDEKLRQEISWEAHRKLAETLHQQIEKLLHEQSLNWKDIGGIVLYKGPGSFTGLRIGFSVGNALAYTNRVPVAAVNGDGWQISGVKCLLAGQGTDTALPEYGGPAHTTTTN